MSKIIASAAIRGAHELVRQAEEFFAKAREEKGEDTKVEFPETAFYLPMANALLGAEVKTVGEMKPILDHARDLLGEAPSDADLASLSGRRLDAGVATLLAEEIIVALRYLDGQEPQPDCNGFFSDTILRTLGIQLVDGRMPGFAAILGAAPDTETAVNIVRELQKRSILTFVGSSARNGVQHRRPARSRRGVEMGWDTYIVPYGRDTDHRHLPAATGPSAARSPSAASRRARRRKCLLYCKDRVFAFGLALGEVDDLKYATGAGAINMGFPVIADTDDPGDPAHRRLHLRARGPRARPREDRPDVRSRSAGVKVKVTEIDIPVPYAAGLRGRARPQGGHARPVRRQVLHRLRVPAHAGAGRDRGRQDRARSARTSTRWRRARPMPLAHPRRGGRPQDAEGLRADPGAPDPPATSTRRMGIFHMGQRDITWVRISKDAFDDGLPAASTSATILHAQLHAEYGEIVDKVAGDDLHRRGEGRRT